MDGGSQADDGQGGSERRHIVAVTIATVIIVVAKPAFDRKGKRGRCKGKRVL